jgi:hypothetical protein
VLPHLQQIVLQVQTQVLEMPQQRLAPAVAALLQRLQVVTSCLASAWVRCLLRLSCAGSRVWPAGGTLRS